MSVILGRIFGRRADASKATQIVQQEDTVFRKHIVDHEIADEYYGHDHGDGHGENGHKHDKRLTDKQLSSTSLTTSPSFMLHLWSALPILLLAVGSGLTVMLVVVIAVLMNFFIIQMRVHTSKRYVASGIVSFIALCIYLVAR